MTRKIFRSMAAVSLAVLAASLVLIVGVLHGYFQDQVLEELRQKTVYAARGVEQAGMDYLTGDLPRDSTCPRFFSSRHSTSNSFWVKATLRPDTSTVCRPGSTASTPQR